MAATYITAGFMTGDLESYANVPGVEVDAEAFKGILREEIERDYPDAEIEVRWAPGSGVTFHDLVPTIDGRRAGTRLAPAYERAYDRFTEWTTEE